MIAAALLLTAALPDVVAGTWEGTSICQVKPSPCHDEHVIYRISRIGPQRYRIDAYKLVNGEEQFMGAIDVAFDPKKSSLEGQVGSKRGLVHFDIKNLHLSGRLVLADGTLVRLIEVDKR